MEVEMLPVNTETLVKYCDIPAWFDVRLELEIKVLNSFDGIVIREQPVASPYKKYYGETDEPLKWPKEFKTDNWIIFMIHVGKKSIGGLTIACKTAELFILGGRNDLADVWDIRVRPEYRNQGIGTKLFQRAVEWSRNEGYQQICVETQNVNVAACRFYLKQGCKLGGINRYAYYNNPQCADEVQLIWFMDLK